MEIAKAALTKKKVQMSLEVGFNPRSGLVRLHSLFDRNN